ncbi:serine/threonine-protein kinase [Roseospira goensis]|uniref:Serine/threonine-protein kinase n=1 Tax=Roseospira goensis TaxID=391922 RepID=A0A7W6WJH8_9PROT|nr:serine/threonine-protein kinase [Roseospira goensis]MBB4285241.1 serine/threonine-protein kinase [Roseospira goensis]
MAREPEPVDDATRVAPARPARPARIGRYRVDGELGRGAMGVVYAAHDESIDRPVALKTVHADLLAGEDGAAWRARFQREAKAAARCLHPNIVTVFEYGEDAGLAYLAMEYVRGRPLQAFLAHGVQFGVRISLRMILQVLDGLGAAHAFGIVHRDIKPSNIILLAEGKVKVTDFGIARLDSAVSLSQHGTMVGTPGYMAPEQFTGATVDARTDLFAVGVVLYELLTGQKPFPGATVPEVMHAVLNRPPVPPVGRPDPLPPALVAALEGALARDPEARPADAATLARVLKGVLRGAPAERAAPDPDATRVMAPVAAGDRGELDDAALRQAGAHLASYIGPVASVVVREAAPRVSGIRHLYEVLADHIPGEAERRAFLRAATRAALGLGRETAVAAPATAPAPPGGAPAGGVDDAAAERVRLALAQHLGPIAGVLVRQARAEARDAAHLAVLVADQIADPEARARFLDAARG